MTQYLKTVVLLGASYGGVQSARELAHNLPAGWRVLSIDRNERMHHVYVFPRLSVLPGHEHKGYIPTSNIFRMPQSPNHRYLNATVTHLTTTHVTLSRAFPELGIESNVIAFDYCIYALGAKMPGVLNLWDCLPGGESRVTEDVFYGGSKNEGIKWMKGAQAIFERPDVQKVLIVGGGALGVHKIAHSRHYLLAGLMDLEFATDIRTVCPDIEVTLLHSRDRLLPRFDEALHHEILQVLDELNITFIPSERVDLSTISSKIGRRAVMTLKGREIETDFIMLCTGQTPNTSLLKLINPELLNSNGLARVKRTMQLTSLPCLAPNSIGDQGCAEKGEFDHMFAVGDAADAFGAIQAGHTASYQARVAAENILKLIARSESPKEEHEPLTDYQPGLPGIKVSLGIKKSAFQMNGVVGSKQNGLPDLDAAYMWPWLGADPEAEGGMWQ